MFRLFISACLFIYARPNSVALASLTSSQRVLRGSEHGPSSSSSNLRGQVDQERDLADQLRSRHHGQHRRRLPPKTDAPTTSPAPTKAKNGGGGNIKTSAPTTSPTPAPTGGEVNDGTPTASPTPSPTPAPTPSPTPAPVSAPTPPRTCFDPACPDEALDFCCGAGTFCYTEYDKFDNSNTCENSDEPPVCMELGTQQKCDSGPDKPVCGCDGISYLKDKCAFLAGTGVRYEGGCNGSR